MKCNIIIPVWNHLELTKRCIESIVENTHYPYNLIIVDNASDVPTKQYLEGLRGNKAPEVTLIRNEDNRGFIKAVNQGIKASREAYICLLNNDTEVTEGWLTEMVKVAEAKPDIGIVNPNSNTLGAKPKKGQTFTALGMELKSATGEYSNLAWACGFCMLIKSEVVQKVGLMDEVFGMGMFEDADFSKRAQEQGYISVCAKAAYVYHHERRSFMKFRKFDQDFNRNRQIFHAKWGKQERLLYILTKANAGHIEKTSRDILKFARQGHIIWIFLKGQNRQVVDPGFSTSIYNLPEHFFNLVSVWRIIKRKKKFDKIYADDAAYAKMLDNFKVFHRAEVVYKQL